MHREAATGGVYGVAVGNYHLECYLHDILESLVDLWLAKSGGEAREGGVRQDRPLFRIEQAVVQGSDGVVVLAQFDWRREIETANRQA